MCILIVWQAGDVFLPLLLLLAALLIRPAHARLFQVHTATASKHACWPLDWGSSASACRCSWPDRRQRGQACSDGRVEAARSNVEPIAAIHMQFCVFGPSAQLFPMSDPCALCCVLSLLEMHPPSCCCWHLSAPFRCNHNSRTETTSLPEQACAIASCLMP